MKCGSVVIVAAAGEYGKSRPAVVVQADAFPEAQASLIICRMTSELVDTPDFRVTIDPGKRNGLRTRSQIMADKPVTVRRSRIARSIGHVDEGEVGRLNLALAFVMGLAD